VGEDETSSPIVIHAVDRPGFFDMLCASLPARHRPRARVRAPDRAVTGRSEGAPAVWVRDGAVRASRGAAA
jgi:hypothetical protein